MIPFLVVVRDKRRQQATQVGLPEHDDPIQTFLLDRPDKPLGVRIAIRRPTRRLHDADAHRGQRLPERRAPLGVPITEQDTVVPQ